MPALEDRPSNALVKFMYIGNSGTGKTGSLVSLVKEGYKLRILDMDNGIDALAEQVKEQCPENMKNISYQSFRDKYKSTPMGIVVNGRAEAYTNMLKALNKWDDDTIPEEWGEDTFLVIDSLTAVGKAAFNWAKGLDPSAKDGRQWFFSAQQSIETLLDMLTSESFRTNVVIISHVQIIETPEGMKGVASSIGSALGPKIPKFFNTLVAAERKGTGDRVRRSITTRPTQMLDLKVPNEEKVGATLDLNTGLATIVKELKG